MGSNLNSHGVNMELLCFHYASQWGQNGAVMGSYCSFYEVIMEKFGVTVEIYGVIMELLRYSSGTFMGSLWSTIAS